MFAALNLIDENVIAEYLHRHRHQEFLRFLRRIDRTAPKELDVHIVLDNYGTHTHEAVRRWLEARPRYHLHFTPTRASWLNLVERFFAEITEKSIRRGTFHSATELERRARLHSCPQQQSETLLLGEESLRDPRQGPSRQPDYFRSGTLAGC